VRDQADLEAAGVELGADLEVREARLSVQNKERKDPLLCKEGRDAWRDVSRIAQIRGHEPVLRWCEGQGPGKPQLDLVVVREQHYAELAQLAGWYQGTIKCD
jgi:hypothetical protein